MRCPTALGARGYLDGNQSAERSVDQIVQLSADMLITTHLPSPTSRVIRTAGSMRAAVALGHPTAEILLALLFSPEKDTSSPGKM